MIQIDLDFADDNVILALNLYDLNKKTRQK